MPNRGDRGGSKTRAHIAAVATGLFLERGFDDVTIAEVAAAADVSKVTVFSHFDRKEDLLLDRLPDALDIVRTAIRDRPDDITVVEAIRRAAIALTEQRHPLSVLNEGIEPFMRIAVNAPSLIARLRAFEHEIEVAMSEELEADARFTSDSALAAAMIVAAYRIVAVRTIQRRLAADDSDDITTMHYRHLDQAFRAVENGIRAGEPTSRLRGRGNRRDAPAVE